MSANNTYDEYVSTISTAENLHPSYQPDTDTLSSSRSTPRASSTYESYSHTTPADYFTSITKDPDKRINAGRC